VMDMKNLEERKLSDEILCVLWFNVSLELWGVYVENR
jgi:hypothetical protein